MLFEAIDSRARDLNGVQPDTSLCIAGQYVFAAYVDGDLNAVVARRELSGGPWEKAIIGTGVADDAHNGCSVGVDPHGYVHVSWNQHSSPMNYLRSTEPCGLHFGLGSPISDGVPLGSVTYPRFYRAGSELYWLFRDGNSSTGDIWMLRWGVDGWAGNPLILGCGTSPYLGQCQPLPNGDLVIAWTHRKEAGLYNEGIRVARYRCTESQWTLSSGETLPLPLCDEVPGFASGDMTISNVGMSVAVAPSGALHVAFLAHSARGFREVLHAMFVDGDWRVRQVTAIEAPRLRMCPGGPQDGPPRPCDMEVMGPTLFCLSESSLLMFWSRAASVSRGVWARPGGAMFASASEDGGGTWASYPVERGLTRLAGELPRESGGFPYMLWQAASSTAVAPLELAVVDEVLPVPAGRITLHNGGPATLPSIQVKSGSFALSAWIRPEATGREMAICDQGGPVPRSFRLLIWGGAATGTLAYDATMAQVLIGNCGGGWGLVRYVPLTVKPGQLSHVALSWREKSVSIYLNGDLVESLPFQDAPLCSAPLVVGGLRSALGVVERAFEGFLSLSWFNRGLTDREVKMLARMAPEM